MDTLSKAFALILAVLILYMFPISETYERQDDISYIVALESVTSFVDSARKLGYITPTMYDELVKNLEKTGNTYNIVMEHQHKQYIPVYIYQEDPGYAVEAAKRGITDNRPIFLDNYVTQYDAYHTQDILEVLFPEVDPADPDPPDVRDPRRFYRMSVGDTFKVTVTNTNRTNATVIRDILTGGNTPNERIVIPYGGMVENEDY
jgi:hypothetical protein